MKKGLRWLAVLSVCTLVVTSEGAGLLHAQQTDNMPSDTETAEAGTEINETEVQETEVPETEVPETENTETESTEQPEDKPGPLLQGIMKNSDGSYSFYIDGEKLKNSWKTVKGNKYYFGKNGNAYTGLKKINNNYFCFSQTGKMQTGWNSMKRAYWREKSTRIKRWLHLPMMMDRQAIHRSCWIHWKSMMQWRLSLWWEAVFPSIREPLNVNLI